MDEPLPRAITRRTAPVPAWLIGLAVTLPVVVPAMLQPWSFWHRTLIAFVGFTAGRLVQLGVTRWQRTTGDALRCFAFGGALALVGLGALLSPLVKTQRTRAMPSVFVPTRHRYDPTPADPPVHRPGTWKAVSSNDHMACAIRDDATVWCWGDVAIFDEDHTESPRQVPGLERASAISVGLTSACALADRHVWCFGVNWDGGIGVPPSDASDVRREPVRVPIADDLVAVSAGSLHACALAASGAVWCWGTNNHGEIGILPKASHGAFSHEPDEHLGPTRVAIPPATAIAAGDGVSCAVGRDDAEAWCWGAHDVVTSMGASSDPAAPSVVPGLRAVTAIAAGRKQICVLAEEAAPTCWGFAAGRDMSRRADPDPNELHPHPEAFGAKTLSVGHSHACAVLANGDARCWGDNGRGELGNGRVEPYVTMHELEGVRVAGVPKLVTIAAGGFETCGLTAGGEMWCWGQERCRS